RKEQSRAQGNQRGDVQCAAPALVDSEVGRGRRRNRSTHIAHSVHERRKRGREIRGKVNARGPEIGGGKVVEAGGKSDHGERKHGNGEMASREKKNRRDPHAEPYSVDSPLAPPGTAR